MTILEALNYIWMNNQEGARHVILTGQGGSGKSTTAKHLMRDLLINNTKGPIPIYINLADMYGEDYITRSILSNYCGAAKLSETDYSRIESLYRLFNKVSGAMREPSFILILDGLDDAEITRPFNREIKELANCKAIQILVTVRSRKFVIQNYSDVLQSFHELTLNPLSDELIHRVLKEKAANPVRLNSSLLELLRIPMHLAMFTGLASDASFCPENVKNVVDLFNSSKSREQHRLTIKHPEDGDIIRFATDYLMPSLAYKLDRMSFLESRLKEELYSAFIFCEEHYASFRGFYRISKMSRNALFDLFINEIFIPCGYLQKEGDVFQFTHHNWLDYFQACFFKNELEYIDTDESGQDPHEVIQSAIKTQLLRWIGELLGEDRVSESNSPSHLSKWLRRHCVRGKKCDNPTIVANIIEIMVVARHGLVNECFDNLDLSSARFYGSDLSGSSFRNAIVRASSFQNESLGKGIAISNDGKFVVYRSGVKWENPQRVALYHTTDYKQFRLPESEMSSAYAFSKDSSYFGYVVHDAFDSRSTVLVYSLSALNISGTKTAANTDNKAQMSISYSSAELGSPVDVFHSDKWITHIAFVDESSYIYTCSEDVDKHVIQQLLHDESPKLEEAYLRLIQSGFAYLLKYYLSHPEFEGVFKRWLHDESPELERAYEDLQKSKYLPLLREGDMRREFEKILIQELPTLYGVYQRHWKDQASEYCENAFICEIDQPIKGIDANKSNLLITHRDSLLVITLESGSGSAISFSKPFESPAFFQDNNDIAYFDQTRLVVLQHNTLVEVANYKSRIDAISNNGLFFIRGDRICNNKEEIISIARKVDYEITEVCMSKSGKKLAFLLSPTEYSIHNELQFARIVDLETGECLTYSLHDHAVYISFYNDDVLIAAAPISVFDDTGRVFIFLRCSEHHVEKRHVSEDDDSIKSIMDKNTVLLEEVYSFDIKSSSILGNASAEKKDLLSKIVDEKKHRMGALGKRIDTIGTSLNGRYGVIKSDKKIHLFSVDAPERGLLLTKEARERIHAIVSDDGRYVVLWENYKDITIFDTVEKTKKSASYSVLSAGFPGFLGFSSDSNRLYLGFRVDQKLRKAFDEDESLREIEYEDCFSQLFGELFLDGVIFLKNGTSRPMDSKAAKNGTAVSLQNGIITLFNYNTGRVIADISEPPGCNIDGCDFSVAITDDDMKSFLAKYFRIATVPPNEN